MLYDFTVSDVAKRNAQLFPDRIAVVEENIRLTFKQFLDWINRLAVGLRREGIKRGDRIAVVSRNNLESFLLFFASAQCGAIYVPINTRLSQGEIEYILDDCQPKLLFAENNFHSLLGQIIIKVDSIKKRYSLSQEESDFLNFDHLMENDGQMKEINVRRDDGLIIIYTAAVGGRPRGGLLTHGNVLASNLQVMYGLSLLYTDIYLSVLPLFHVAGLLFSSNVFHAGGTNVIMSQFDPERALELIEVEKITIVFSFSPMLEQLVEKMKERQYQLSSVRMVVSITYPECFKEFQAVTKSDFFRVWGQTETLSFITACRHDERPGSIGRPLPLTLLRIVDDNDRPVETGQAGEIVVRSPQVFKGYWNLKKETAFTFRDGWHHTGDLGYVDEEGFLWFVGRKQEKDLIKTGGENVYPAEVESVILKHPKVKEVVVIGVPDPKWVESIKAVCVVKEGENVTEKELIEFVSQRIASYKKPKHVQFVESLPKAASGEVDRTKVKEIYGG